MFADFGSPAGGRIRAVLFDFFGTLTLGLRRGRAHATVARALGADPAKFFTALTWTFFDRASGRYGDARQTMRELNR